MTDKKKPEALRLADALAYCDASVASQAAAELRRQHAEIADLRAQLSAVPLMGAAGDVGWVSVDERLPEWAARDDTPCFINNKEVHPTLTSETVLVALKGGGVRTDKLTTIEGKSDGWWHTYGERVVAWQQTPPPPPSSAKGVAL